MELGKNMSELSDVYLVPSARRSCMLVIGLVWSTSKRVLMLSRCSRCAGWCELEEEEAGKEPGIEDA
jgi:hypothetical protein